MFHYVTHNGIDCGLQAKPAELRDERLSCQTMVKYA